MNYDKLSRSLRYYYEKGIMQKVAGKNERLNIPSTRTFRMPRGGGGDSGQNWPAYV